MSAAGELLVIILVAALATAALVAVAALIDDGDYDRDFWE
jgi:hypothetical protein